MDTEPTLPHRTQSDSDGRPGYDEAAEAVRTWRKERGIVALDWTVERTLDVAYPIIVEAWMGPLAEWRKDMRDAHAAARATAIAEVVAALRRYSDEHGGVAMQFDALAPWIEREFGADSAS